LEETGEKLSEVRATSDRFGENRRKASEVRATSDRFGGNRCKAVRSKSNIRQVWGKPVQSCQKKEQLQTGLGETGAKLSEERATSDKFGGNRRKAVRRKSNFRQVWRKPAESCQKKEQLQISLEETGEKLSELRACLDRFGGNRWKAVRSIDCHMALL
jgi:hypothetical protein